MPVEFRTAIGDAFHNLRSSLDSVAYELAPRHVGDGMTERQQKAVQFPICVDREEFDEYLGGRVQPDLYGEAERSALRFAQPFALREEAAGLGVSWATSPQEDYRINELARLSRLNNLDKHRYLPVLTWYADFPYFTDMVPACRLELRRHVPPQDGDLVGNLTFAEDAVDPSAKLVIEMGLAFADDPGYATDFLDALDRWHSYLTGWILPRIFSVAEGSPPPIVIANAG